MGKKGAPKVANCGRKKGSVNKFNADVRQFVINVAEQMQADPTKSLSSLNAEQFWTKVFPKIIPKEVNVKQQLWVRTLSDEELDVHIERLRSEIESKT